VAIARAMILKPRLVVLDEPTSALDRTVQIGILTLLEQLQEAYGLTYVCISHDLAVIRAVADEIAVMKNGRIVEQGAANEIVEHPRAPYTRALIAAAFQTGET
jgi:ABC-type microcin C transport system duplicated ATPase subunit YejF